MKIERDEFGDWLTIDGEEFGPSGDGEFEVMASRLRGARLGDLPPGFSIRLCDRVIGSKELTGRHPDCTFEQTRDHRLLAHGETVFIAENEDVLPEDRQHFLRDALLAARRSLAPLIEDGTVMHFEEKVFEEIAYLNYSVVLHDQPILDAELFIEALDGRIHEGLDRPLIFLCHASELHCWPSAMRLVPDLVRIRITWHGQLMQSIEGLKMSCRCLPRRCVTTTSTIWPEWPKVQQDPVALWWEKVATPIRDRHYSP